jgi:hypothetical protein
VSDTYETLWGRITILSHDWNGLSSTGGSRYPKERFHSLGSDWNLKSVSIGCCDLHPSSCPAGERRSECALTCAHLIPIVPGASRKDPVRPPQRNANKAESQRERGKAKQHACRQTQNTTHVNPAPKVSGAPHQALIRAVISNVVHNWEHGEAWWDFPLLEEEILPVVLLAPAPRLMCFHVYVCQVDRNRPENSSFRQK